VTVGERGLVTGKRITPALRALASDHLIRNSAFLTMNTVVMSGAGFAFWLINSHLFSAGQIGTATTLISGASIISYFSLFGFNTTFVRFLPTSRNRDAEMNTGLVVVFCAALVIATAYVLLVPSIVPRLTLVRGSPGLAIGFVALTAFSAVNLVTDSVFIALRKAQYNVVCDGIIQGAVKLSLPILLVELGAFGIFLASGLASTVAVVASIIFMVRVFGYRPRVALSRAVLRQSRTYSAANYVANLLSLSTVFVIPLTILSLRGPRQAGFYFIAYQIASLLFALGYAMSSSLFAEGSRAGAHVPSLLRRSAKTLALVCVPCSVLVAASGHWLLLLFGPQYSANATLTLAILAMSAPSVAFCSAATTVLRINKQLREVVLTNAVFAVAIIGLTALGAKHGIEWVALGWLLGNTTAGILATAFAAVHTRPRG
jgi:O-antigen/teichoic acid export membrane protein